MSDRATQPGDDGDEAMRAYVTRLWAKDWECAEDAVYDGQCDCGEVWKGHPNPHAATCPAFGARGVLRCAHRSDGFCGPCRASIAAASS